MINNNNIKELLNKYLEGETSLKEEKQLRYYFLFEEVDPELESYKALFQFFEQEKKVEFQQPPQLDKIVESGAKTIFLQYWQIAVAAVLILGIGISWYSANQSGNPESLSHEEVLLAQKYLNLSLGTLDKNYAMSTQLLSNAEKIEESTQKVSDVSKLYNSQRNQLQHLNYIDQSFKKLENIKNIQKSRIKLVM
jgi:dsDNA-specific endonuclease/ATPase MutS2